MIDDEHDEESEIAELQMCVRRETAEYFQELEQLALRRAHFDPPTGERKRISEMRILWEEKPTIQ